MGATPYESTLKLNQTGTHGKVEWNGIFGNRLFATTMVGRGGYTARSWIQDQSIGVPNRINRNTSYQTGESFDSRSTIARTYYRYRSNGVSSATRLRRTVRPRTRFRVDIEHGGAAKRSSRPAPKARAARPFPIRTRFTLSCMTRSGVCRTRPWNSTSGTIRMTGLGDWTRSTVYATDSWRLNQSFDLQLGPPSGAFRRVRAGAGQGAGAVWKRRQLPAGQCGILDGARASHRRGIRSVWQREDRREGILGPL